MPRISGHPGETASLEVMLAAISAVLVLGLATGARPESWWSRFKASERSTGQLAVEVIATELRLEGQEWGTNGQADTLDLTISTGSHPGLYSCTLRESETQGAWKIRHEWLWLAPVGSAQETTWHVVTRRRPGLRLHCTAGDRLPATGPRIEP